MGLWGKWTDIPRGKHKPVGFVFVGSGHAGFGELYCRALGDTRQRRRGWALGTPTSNPDKEKQLLGGIDSPRRYHSQRR